MQSQPATSVVAALSTTVNMNEALLDHSDKCGGSEVIEAAMTKPDENPRPQQNLTSSYKNPINGVAVSCNSDSHCSLLQDQENEGGDAVKLDNNVLDLITNSNALPPAVISMKQNTDEVGGSFSERSYEGQRSAATEKELKIEIESENEYSGSAIEKYTRIEEVADFNDFNVDEMRDLRRCLVKGEQAGMIELDLDILMQESEGYEYCCPNCNGCVKRIIIRKREAIQNGSPDVFRCVSCFSFLVFAGRQLVSLFCLSEKRKSTTPIKVKTLGQEEEEGVHVSVSKSIIVDSTNKDMVANVVSSAKEYIKEDMKLTSESLVVEEKDSAFQPPTHISITSAAVSKGPKQLKKDGVSVKKEETIIRVEETTETGRIEGEVQQVLVGKAGSIQMPEQQSLKNLEMLKSIVYGGLIESIASLGIVTSAVGSKISTLNLLAMSLSNLFGGIVILLHNIQELRGNVDMYYESLGRRDNGILHVTVSVLSFLIFGLVPPLTYVFSFPKNGSTESKLGVALAASLFCIILLSIGKTYVQRPPGWVAYVKTVIQYVCSSAVVFGVCYVAGNLILKLVHRIGLVIPDDHLTLSLVRAMDISKSLRQY